MARAMKSLSEADARFAGLGRSVDFS
jgi:hypothetical protein